MIRVGLVGIGNCASALLQGLEYYGNAEHNNSLRGLTEAFIGPYPITSVEVVLAFDVDKRKVNRPLEEAIYAGNNCCYTMVPRIYNSVKVLCAPILDGVSEHMKESFCPEESPVAETPEAMAQILTEAKLDVLVNYLPVGSEQATKFWAETCVLAKVAMMNCIPVFIASDPVYADKFREAGVPLIGDDIKSQFGASIVSQVLEELAIDRGHTVVYHVQQNTGGNTDFKNMLNQSRLVSKKISKENVIRSQHALRGEHAPFVHAGPSDYVEVYGDTKICQLDLELKGFGGAPVHLDLKLRVQDSPNSAGVVIDGIRYLKLAQDKGLAGPLDVSSFLCKHPPTATRFGQAKALARSVASDL